MPIQLSPILTGGLAIFGAIVIIVFLIYVLASSFIEARKDKKWNEFLTVILAGIAIIISLWPNEDKNEKLDAANKKIEELDSRIDRLSEIIAANKTIDALEYIPPKNNRETSTARRGPTGSTFSGGNRSTNKTSSEASDSVNKSEQGEAADLPFPESRPPQNRSYPRYDR